MKLNIQQITLTKFTGCFGMFKITDKTKLKAMAKLAILIDLSDVDILKECSKYPLPEKIRGIKPVQTFNIPFRDLAWLWDIKEANERIIAICEIFFYPNLSKFKKFFFRKSDTWAKRWLFNCPLIDFYNFANYVNKWIEQEAKDYSNMKIDLTKEERQAGYGDTDPLAVKKMIDTFAKRQHISDLEEASKYPCSVYKFVFKVDIDEANKQRRYNKIISKAK